MAKSLEFPGLFNHFNMIAMRPWSHEQLVEVTLHHISYTDANGRKKCSLMGEHEKNTFSRRPERPLDKKWMENAAHLLANMHIAVRQKPENDSYKYCFVCSFSQVHCGITLLFTECLGMSAIMHLRSWCNVLSVFSHRDVRLCMTIKI